MLNWKGTIMRWLSSHPATEEETDLIAQKCGLHVPPGVPVLGTAPVTDSKGKTERRRITLHMRTPEMDGHLHSTRRGVGGEAPDIEGAISNKPAWESGDFLVLDEEVCLVVSTFHGRFAIIPWDEITYVEA